MSGMFQNATSFSYDLSSWKTTNVTDMSYMFNGAVNINTITIGYWDTSKVTNMNHMFDYAYNFNCENLNSWDTSKVTNMSYMFRYAKKLRLIL